MKKNLYMLAGRFNFTTKQAGNRERNRNRNQNRKRKMKAQIEIAIANLKAQHQSDWLSFNERTNAIMSIVGARNSEEDISEDITSDALLSAGFTPAEAEALLFIFTEECMGQAVKNLEMLDRWFCYCA